MAKKKTSPRRTWTLDDLKLFRQLARERKPTRSIAKRLKRTLGATYQRAAVEGIALKGGRAR